LVGGGGWERARTLPNVAILDYDALMHKENIIRLNGQYVRTSTIVFTLWRTDKLEDWLSHNDLLFDKLDSDWYENVHLKNLRTLALQQDIFVFSKDLEGILQSKKTKRTSKPIKVLESVLDRIEQDNISSEFYEMCEFLRKYTS
jgi:hypothetical protein